jgi:hypothetical protein
MHTPLPRIADEICEVISFAITRVREIFATIRPAVVATTPTERRDKILFHVL